MFQLSLCAILAYLFLAFISQAASPFNGKDLDDWKTKPRGKNKDLWSVGIAAVHPERTNELIVKKGSGEMVNTPSKANGKSLDIYSAFTYGDARIELEIMVPKGSNSGIYLHGEYEVQVLDSHGRTKLGMGDMGAIYGAKPPAMNASKKPGEWQKYEIIFRAPKYKDGKKVKNAYVEKIVLNGKVIEEKVELSKPTPGGLTGKEMAKGPIMFQGDHCPVAYRNIKISPLK
ncbi:MAG: DUF1080 domain-containing protein [Opitutales bacterium]